MSEAIYHKVQLGRQSAVGTAVAATTVLPVDAGFLGFELDRATESPDEDYGGAARERPGRTPHGVRGANATLPLVMRYQDWMHALEMHAAGSVAASGSNPYTYAYTMDETSDTLKPYTLEYGVDGSTQDEWRAYGVIADELELGFDALSAPGNSMWRGTLGLVAINREPSAITGTATAPATLESLEGHLTTIAVGTTGTAFASLTALTGSLKQFSFRSTNNAVGRAYGATSGDTATDIGRSAKGEVEFDALIAISATTKTNILDIFEVAGSVATEQRFRVTCTGSGSNVFKIDFRARFRAVNLGEHENEHLYAVNGVWVKDSTLGGRGQFILNNAIATIP